MQTEITSGRAIGQYPLSIATSLAIESCVGVHPEITDVKHPPILDFPELWINVKTLFRNLFGSLDKDGQSFVLPQELASTLADELEIIPGILTQINPKLKIVYYVCDYANMDRKYPHAKVRMDNTPKQKEYSLMLRKTLEILLQTQKSKILTYPLKIKPDNSPNALILTHYAYDIISHKNFNRFTLLESHTGMIKGPASWYTKYYNGKHLTVHLPFREDLLQVFGDNETFHPMSSKIREEILELARQYRWNHTTGYDKIAYCMDQIKDPYLRAVMKDILTH